MDFFHFFSSFNTAYNNKFRFFFFKKIKNLENILKLFVQKGLILGFFFKNDDIVVMLKYIKDVPFFKVLVVSKPSRKNFYSKKKRIRGKMSGNDLYILNSSKKGFFFSDNFENKYFSKDGGEVFLKILFYNENNFSKKNSFI